MFMMQFNNPNFEKIELDRDKVMAHLILARRELMKNFLSRPEDSRELKKVGRQLIKMEKDNEYYNPANWSKMFP